MPLKSWTPGPVIEMAMRVEEQRMAKAMVGLQREVKDTLNVGGAGIPSRPGDPPHKQTGELYNSIGYRVFRRSGQVVGQVFSTSRKWRRLEFGFRGTDSLGRRFDQQPRPFVRPSWLRTKSWIGRILTKGR